LPFSTIRQKRQRKGPEFLFFTLPLSVSYLEDQLRNFIELLSIKHHPVNPLIFIQAASLLRIFSDGKIADKFRIHTYRHDEEA